MSNRTAERKPPQDKQAEVSLLGALLLDNSYFDNVAMVVRPHDFYDKRHQIIFEAISRLILEGEPADLVTLTDELVKSKQLDRIGGRAFLVELTADVYSAANCERYAEIIKEKAVLRSVISHGQKAILKAYDEHEASEVVEELEANIFQLATRSVSTQTLSSQEAAVRFMAMLDEVMQAKDHPELRQSWITTGLMDLDQIFFRWEPGDLILAAGRPGDGKTGLALQICSHLDKQGAATAFFTLEMSPERLMQRLVSQRAGIELQSIRKGELTDEEYLKISKLDFVDWKIFIDDCRGSKTPFEIRSKSRNLVSRHDVKLIVVDYIQLMEYPGFKGDNRAQEVGKISAALKSVATELGVPVLALCQMNRGIEARGKDSEPELWDLRESGNLEQDADSVLFVWHPYRKDSQLPNNVAKIKVAKQRHGPTGKIDVYWREMFTTFENLTSYAGTLT